MTKTIRITYDDGHEECLKEGTSEFAEIIEAMKADTAEAED